MKILNFRRRLAAAIAACGVWVPSMACGAGLTVNLVTNPSFERVNTAVPGPFTSVRVLDWVDADGDPDADDTFVYPYSSAYSGDPAPPGAGDYHFTGGFNTTVGVTTISQSIDVSTGDSGGLIAQGNAQYDLRGFFSSYFAGNESSLVRVRFLDTGLSQLGSAEIGGEAFLGGLPIIEGRVFWGQDAATGTLPAGTASLAVELVPQGGAENYDGYVDLVDFRVGGLPEDLAMKLEVNVSTGKAHVKNLTGTPINTNYYDIRSPSGSLSVAGWNSLQDQDFEGSGGFSGIGDGWEESGGSSSTVLAESFLLASSLVSQQIVDLGNAFDVEGSQDLTFRYGTTNGQLLYGVVDYIAIDADFDDDGFFNCDDVDALVGEIVQVSNGGEADLSFDLTGDSQVNDADLDQWLADAASANGLSGAYFPGDANLDGTVDETDFGIWNGSNFSLIPEFCSGDFNADGAVDVSDFNHWNTNKFMSSKGHLTSVPEPTSVFYVGWALLGVGGLAAKRRRWRRRFFA